VGKCRQSCPMRELLEFLPDLLSPCRGNHILIWSLIDQIWCISILAVSVWIMRCMLFITQYADICVHQMCVWHRNKLQMQHNILCFYCDFLLILLLLHVDWFVCNIIIYNYWDYILSITITGVALDLNKHLAHFFGSCVLFMCS